MDIQALINDYATLLKSEISFEKIGEYYEITTPYLDNANDYLQIYVRQDGDDIYFTDDSATIRGLKMSGFQFTTTYLQQILNPYGVKLNGYELTAKAPMRDGHKQMRKFISAMCRLAPLDPFKLFVFLKEGLI